MSMPGEPSPQEVFDALETILTDEDTFQKVVHSVFNSIDSNHNGNVEAKELGDFLASVCGNMGIGAPPTSNQVLHVFKHLDLNSDNSVSLDELEVFLRHLFTEQMGQARDKLDKAKAAARGDKVWRPPGSGVEDTKPKRAEDNKPKQVKASLWANLGKK